MSYRIYHVDFAEKNDVTMIEMRVRQHPYFSVIIPARNEEEYIAKAIESVKSQNYKYPVELIVVDNASIDKTAKVAKQCGAEVIPESRVGLPQARETGRLAAKGTILVYVDADSVLPKNYLTSVRSVFENDRNIVGVTNPFNFYDGSIVHSTTINAFFKIIYPLQNLLLRFLGKSRQLLGGSFAVRSETIQKMNGFNTNIMFAGEDLATSKSLSKFGEITFIKNLYSQTSARRFRNNGTIRTCGLYFKNFFSVLIFNRTSDGTLSRKTLKIVLFLAVILWIIKYSHVSHFLFSHHNRHALLFSLGIIVIILVATTIYGIFHPMSLLFGPLISRFDTHEKLVALTFDDGPSALSTKRVLDILRDEKIQATFFVVGANAERHPSIIKLIIADGHTLGNHSYNHGWTFPFSRSAVIAKSIENTETIIQSIVGELSTKKIFRPPHGWHTPWMLSQAVSLGFKVITWTVSLDYIPGVTAKAIISHYTKKTKPGSILLFHDSIWERPNNKRENLTLALPEIIKNLKSRGYKFVSINDML
jgi:peptidoglycan-N-acetylglucosamine deacetylase